MAGGRASSVLRGLRQSSKLLESMQVRLTGDLTVCIAMAFGKASDHGGQCHFSDYENTPYALGVDWSIAEQGRGNCFEE